MKETGGRRYPQRLTGHSGIRPGRIARNHPERTKQQHQQLLCVHGQGGDYPAEGDNAFIIAGGCNQNGTINRLAIVAVIVMAID